MNIVYKRAREVAEVMGIGEILAESFIDCMLDGDFEFMDNLGVSITDASLEAYADQMGISKDLLGYHEQRVAIASDYFMAKTR